MKITSIQGNINDYDISTLHKDRVEIEWYQAQKRIGRYTTQQGITLLFEFDSLPSFNHGDILYLDSKSVIYLEILPCEVIAIQESKKNDIARICYIIGNMHSPLFVTQSSKDSQCSLQRESDSSMEFLIPYEKSLENLLHKMGIHTQKRIARLETRMQITFSFALPKEPVLQVANNICCVVKSKNKDSNANNNTLYQ